jgi:hypothetical protein
VSASIGDVEALRPGAALDIGVDVDLGGLAPLDVRVEALLGLRGDDGELRAIDVVELRCESAQAEPSDDADADGEPRRSHLYVGRLSPQSSGAYGYAVRVRPAGEGPAAFDDPVVWA